jgi:hypothetical protein
MENQSEPIQAEPIQDEPIQADDKNGNPISRSSSISTDSDYENYVIRAKICKRLSRELGLEEITYDITDYEPPENPGLENSNVIIPAYYQIHKHPSKIIDLDYLYMIKDDIRNFRQLNKYQLKYIKDLSHDHKNELIEIFNNCIGAFNEIIK